MRTTQGPSPSCLEGRGPCTPEPARQGRGPWGPTHRRRAFWFGRWGFMVRSLQGAISFLSRGCSCRQTFQVVWRGDDDVALLRQVRCAHAADGHQAGDRNGGCGLEEACPAPQTSRVSSVGTTWTSDPPRWGGQCNTHSTAVFLG